MYLKSVAGFVGPSHYKLKYSQNSALDVFSQTPQQDDDYHLDSFCVQVLQQCLTESFCIFCTRTFRTQSRTIFLPEIAVLVFDILHFLCFKGRVQDKGTFLLEMQILRFK